MATIDDVISRGLWRDWADLRQAAANEPSLLDGIEHIWQAFAHDPHAQRHLSGIFNLIAEQWDRIGQFHAAFPAGHTTASAALQRTNRFQPSNRIHAAIRELGRALNTEFVLQYMSEPQLRPKVRQGVLRVEQLHALARAVHYGQKGRISAREVYDQVKTCSCLTLILACIVYWQAREISRMTAAPDFPFDHELLRPLSPIEWKNVILCGEIEFDPAKLWPRVRQSVIQHEPGYYPDNECVERGQSSLELLDQGSSIE